MNAVQKYLLYLLKCSVNNIKTNTIPEDISLFELFSLSKREQVENLVYTALPSMDGDDALTRKFRQCYEKAIVRESKQEFILSMISDAFTNAGIKHIPLKGSVIKFMYPSPDLRQSGDIDILTDTYSGVEEIMTSLGFSRDDYKNDKHISYTQGKMHVEIHSYLTDTKTDFCDDVWNNVKHIDGERYEMTPEFLYVYLLLHLKTHIICGGAGIKLILDFYVLNQKCNLDKEKINEFAKKAKVSNFMRYTEALVNSWFNGIDYKDQNVSILETLILDSPVYGSFENYVKMHYNASSKTGNIINIIFLPYSRMVKAYPILKKAPFLLPFMWGYRIIRRLRAKDNHIKIISNTLLAADNDEIAKYMNFKKMISK